MRRATWRRSHRSKAARAASKRERVRQRSLRSAAHQEANEPGSLLARTAYGREYAGSTMYGRPYGGT